MSKNPLIKGTLILTLAGLISKVLGFVLRIFLSRFLGAESLGIYQLITPVYMLGIVISSFGIQTAISRFVSSVGQRKEQIKILKAGLSMAFAMSVLLSLFIYHRSSWIASYLLNEERCTSLLRVVSFCIPLEAIHICANGYYYGLRKTAVPAISQFLEQIARVAGVFFLFTLTENNGIIFTPFHALGGNLIGDIVCFLFSFSALAMEPGRKTSAKAVCSYPAIYKKITAVAVPLTCNQTIVHMFHSIETVLIPTMLQSYGYSVSKSLSIYGILTGMALPLIMFPSTLTNSFAVLLLPTVSEAHSKGHKNTVLHISRGAVSLCLLLGIFSTGYFLFLGQNVGWILFQNRQVGIYLNTLGFLCPFLFLNITLGSILNGLGKTALVFRNNMISLIIRILFILFIIPKLGIIGYFLGFLISSIVTTFLFFISLRFLKESLLDSRNYIVKPCLSLAASCFVLTLASHFQQGNTQDSLMALMLKSVIFFLLYLGFLKLLIPDFSIHLLTKAAESRIVKQKK